LLQIASYSSFPEKAISSLDGMIKLVFLIIISVVWKLH